MIDQNIRCRLVKSVDVNFKDSESKRSDRSDMGLDRIDLCQRAALQMATWLVYQLVTEVE